MWFSPGLVLGGIYVFVVYKLTGDASQWWLWTSALLAGIVIDAVLWYTTREVPRFKTQTIYTRDKPPS